jgi:hypothetical protein
MTNSNEIITPKIKALTDDELTNLFKNRKVGIKGKSDDKIMHLPRVDGYHRENYRSKMLRIPI